jgi:hypothetical protein
MSQVNVVIGAGSIGQAIARRLRKGRILSLSLNAPEPAYFYSVFSGTETRHVLTCLGGDNRGAR